MLAEANARLSSPLYNIAFMAMALAAVIGGPFSRLGYARRIIAAAPRRRWCASWASWSQAGCASSAWLNILQYLIPPAAVWWAFSELFRQASAASSPCRRCAGPPPRTEPLA